MSETLVIALEILGLGWGGVFLVLFVIYLCSFALSKLFPPKDDKGGAA